MKKTLGLILTCAILLTACASKQKTVPAEFVLYTSVPNPFEEETWIPYSLGSEADVSIVIHDTQGRIIRTFKLGVQAAGSYQEQDKAVYWDGRTDKGEIAPNGVYFCRLQIGDFQEIKKILKLKK